MPKSKRNRVGTCARARGRRRRRRPGGVTARDAARLTGTRARALARSRGGRAVTLSKTKKKGVERKKTLIDQLRAAADEFKAVYLFKYADMKNERMKHMATMHTHASQGGRYKLRSRCTGPDLI